MKEEKIRPTVIEELDALLSSYWRQNNKKLWIIRRWVDEVCNPEYFLTLRLPLNKETDDFDISKETLRQIMKRFEKRLIGRPWKKHHIPFVAFAEFKHTWHYHILLSSLSFREEELYKALVVPGMFGYEIDLSPIQNKYATGIYCTKQLHLDIYGKMVMDTSRIITSYDLFNIPFKRNDMWPQD